MRTVVAVLRGGPSSEYEVSLKTGASVLESLDRDKYEPRDVFISRKGEWHSHGVPMLPERALRGADVAFNAMHGEFGEDGGVQRLLEVLKMPYTGSNTVASAVAFNKNTTRRAVEKLGVKVPRGILVPKTGDIEKEALKIFRSFPHPAIVKPVIGGSSVGTTVADNFHALAWGLEQAFKIGPQALVEEFVRGKEATVGVIDRFRNEEHYSLLPVEITPPTTCNFFDYEAKYSGQSREECPGSFSSEEKHLLANISRKVHRELNLRHYSRADFIVSKRGIYFLEVNTLPGLTKESLLPKALNAVGSKLGEFVGHVVELARGKKHA
jgi:D-alanine-D-alanine ligase